MQKRHYRHAAGFHHGQKAEVPGQFQLPPCLLPAFPAGPYSSKPCRPIGDIPICQIIQYPAKLIEMSSIIGGFAPQKMRGPEKTAPPLASTFNACASACFPLFFCVPAHFLLCLPQPFQVQIHDRLPRLGRICCFFFYQRFHHFCRT